MIVRHPAFPDVEKDVRRPAEWIKAGWVPVIPPPKPKPKPRRRKFPRI